MGDLTARLTAARERVARLTAATEAARGRSESVTAGGLSGYDSAVLSGIRRKPNPRADARRRAAYDREAALWADLRAAEDDVAALERQVAREQAEATAKAELTVADLAAARYVRDRYGWHRVVRVNAKSVTVETPYSWTERIARDDVLEVRS